MDFVIQFPLFRDNMGDGVLFMAERLTFSVTEFIKKRAKAKPGEEGALGPIDDFNRISYSVSKPLFIGTGLATLLLPPLLPAAVITGAWAGSDKLQLEGSKWIRRKMKRENAPAMRMENPRTKGVVFAQKEERTLPSARTPRMKPGEYSTLPQAA